ncbi:unnamed protein product [Alternaria alternata]
MRDVYSKAEFCIAATDAESGNVGLFFDRDVEQLTPVIVEATWSNKDDTSDSSKWPRPGSYLFGFYEIHPRKAIDLAPLNGRAWVTQEHRRILTSFTEALNFCDNELITIQFDVKDDPCHNADQTVDIQLLALMKEDKKEGDDISLAVMGICVVNSKNQDSAFERVGHFEAWYETAKPVLAAYNQAPVQSILLV